MHKLIRRQLKRFFGPRDIPEHLKPFIAAVSAAYEQSDHDRHLLEHSLDLTSKELVERNQKLRQKLLEHQTITESLQESEERYQLAVQGANVGIWDWAISRQEIYYSPRWKEMLGLEHSHLPNTDSWFSRIHPDDQDEFHAALDAHLKRGTSHFELEYRIRHKEGHYLWVVNRGLALWDDKGQPYRIAGSQMDVTTRRHAEEQLRYDAIHDTLTKLPNRTLLLDRLDFLLKHADRDSANDFAILFLDLDRFKLVNDSLGHFIGDQLLIQTANRLQNAIHETDTLARLGGDEFVLLIEKIQQVEDATHVAERLLDCLKPPFSLEGHEVFTNASIGIALSSDAHQQPEDLLRNADTAMYRAKSRGKGCFQVFDTRMHQRATARLQMENDLRRALEDEAFEVYYQPIYNLRHQKPIGFEALARWKHPDLGMVSPSKFIAVAEEIGLITQLDYWVLKESCRQIQHWKETYICERGLTINVNFSARHFEFSGLGAAIEGTLNETGLPGHCLQFELTETALVQFKNQKVEEELSRLKEIGVRLYLDDFGTGYASLNYLHQMPFDGVKIDRSFTQGLETDPRKQVFVNTIFKMAQTLKMEPVVEGIETAGQLQIISSLADCTGQGWHFAPALPVEEAEKILQQAYRRKDHDRESLLG